MCPACLASLSLIVAGALSAGGVTALASKAISWRRDSKSAGVQPGLHGQGGAADGAEEFRSSNEKENES